MQYSAILIAAASLALAQAKIAFTTLPSSVEAGKPVTLKWNGEADGPITITLRKGTSTDLKTIDTITSSATGNSFVWTPSKSLSNANDYALQISQGVDDVNYTGEFSLSGGSDASASSSSASSSSASSYPTTSAPVSSQTSSSASGTVTKQTTVLAINSTTTVPHSVYMTGTAPMVPGAASASGTGVNVSRNTTFSSATPTKGSHSHSGGLQASTTGAASSTDSSSGSETSAAAATSASAGAASHMEVQIGAGLAAVLGLFAML